MRAATHANSAYTLLVVDDNEDNRYTLTRRLKREGYTRISVAENGRLALEMMKASHISDEEGAVQGKLHRMDPFLRLTAVGTVFVWHLCCSLNCGGALGSSIQRPQKF